MKNLVPCSACGSLHQAEALTEFDGQLLCSSCLHMETTRCQRCGQRIWSDSNTCVNLLPYTTIEFRMFRGTLKYNTFLAVLQLLDRICDTALFCTDQEIQDMSWTTFVSGCTQPELIQYLKERRLYVNEPVPTEAEV